MKLSTGASGVQKDGTITLTFGDVERLAVANSTKERIEVAGKLAEHFARGGMDGRQKDIAIEIFRLLVRDAEIKVREALSFYLRTTVDLPRDVALNLAQDEDSVAANILEYTGVLDEEDLLEIIRSTRRTAKLAAIARRESVSSSLSDALLETPDAVVAAELFRNRGADVSETAMLKAIGMLGENESVIDALVERGNLPLACVEKIFTTVSMRMKQRLAARYHLSRHLVEGKMEYAREWATLGATTTAGDENVETLVRRLMEERKLTSSLLVRSLCSGDLRFFEHAMAAQAGVPVENVRQLIQDRGELGFQSLYRQSSLPPSYFSAVKALLEVTQEESRDVQVAPQDFSGRVMRAIVERGYDKSVQYMPLLMAIIQGNAGELASVH